MKIRVLAITMCILYYYDSKDRSCIKTSRPSTKLPTEEVHKEFHDDDDKDESQIPTLSPSHYFFLDFTVFSVVFQMFVTESQIQSFV